MQLTPTNYHSKENKYLTSSKLRDFLTSKEYFKKMHITHKLEKETTDAMIEGSMVDDLLTRGKKHFYSHYTPVERRNKKNPPQDYVEVTQTMWDNALNRAKKLTECSAYKQIEHYEKQVILQLEKPSKNKLFEGAAAMLDFLYVDKRGEVADIVDLKTARTIEPLKYNYDALSHGYDIQLAWYGWLVHELHGIPYNKITYKHLVVEKDVYNINKVGTFIFDRYHIDVLREELMQIMEEIFACKDWKDKDATWEDAHTIINLHKEKRSKITELILEGQMPE